ncbi:hypothetical protein B0A55_07642 [Friedmanniomyces simplex]|uniref:Uncharacterized protein n=1 Tax=Friedmanniomyces simplex TaxID=329884 RepID=A0A4U0X123_9PEZI|nr:hypothetical protein B0A55_07642 [Friedmanniomyces simplex]
MEVPSAPLLFGIPAPSPAVTACIMILNYILFYASTFILVIAVAVGATEIIARLRSNSLGASRLQSDPHTRIGNGACAAITYLFAWVVLTYNSEDSISDGQAAIQRAVSCFGAICGFAVLCVVCVGCTRPCAQNSEEEEEVSDSWSMVELAGARYDSQERMECGSMRAEALWQSRYMEPIQGA